nr:hypothetical protein [Tanacetum cinerariifolium]
GEGSTVPFESHHTPTGASSTSRSHLSPTPRSFIRHESEVPHPNSPPQTQHGGAATTVTSLDVRQGSGNINKTQSMPRDLPLPRVYTLGSDEGKMQQNELMDLVTKLSDRVVALETDLKQKKKVYGAAYTKLIMKGRKIDEIHQDPDISLVQHDVEIQGRYDQDIEFNLDFDAAKHESEVPHPNSPPQTNVADEAASTDVDVNMEGLPLLVYTLGSDEGKMQQNELMDLVTKLSDRVVALETDLKQKKKVYGAAYTKLIMKGRKIDEIHQDPDISLVQHDVEIQGRYDQDIEFNLDFDAAKRVNTFVPIESKVDRAVHEFAAGSLKRGAEKELDQGSSKKQKTGESSKLAEGPRDKDANELSQEELQQMMIIQLRGYSFDELKTLFETTIRRVNTFVPIESKVDRAVHEFAAGSLKRGAEKELDQGSSKKQKTGESSKLAEGPRDKDANELSQEELQQMMIIVPEEGMHIEALQTKYLIIDWEIYTEESRILVQERFNSIELTEDKEREIWVELKRLFEPDTNDELWESQKHIHDITWRMYDTCEVHHVSTKDGVDIYMLAEREYPLSRGVLTQMLGAKLLVEQDNEMSKELFRKIFMQVERPRRRV